MHPNIETLTRVDIADLDGCADVFAEDAVWHFINPLMPEVAGDYAGRDGIKSFFARMAKITGGTFSVRQIDAWPVGDELVVVQTQNTLTIDGQKTVTDVVLVWRFIGGRVAEVWDIPSVFASAVMPPEGTALPSLNEV